MCCSHISEVLIHHQLLHLLQQFVLWNALRSANLGCTGRTGHANRICIIQLRVGRIDTVTDSDLIFDYHVRKLGGLLYERQRIFSIQLNACRIPQLLSISPRAIGQEKLLLLFLQS